MSARFRCSNVENESSCITGDSGGFELFVWGGAAGVVGFLVKSGLITCVCVCMCLSEKKKHLLG